MAELEGDQVKLYNIFCVHLKESLKKTLDLLEAELKGRQREIREHSSNMDAPILLEAAQKDFEFKREKILDYTNNVIRKSKIRNTYLVH